MSVPEPERHKGRLEVHVKAQALARRKYYRLVQKAKRGEISREKVDESYQCWRECASKGDGYKMLWNMDRFYRELWEGGENNENHQTNVASRNGGRAE